MAVRAGRSPLLSQRPWSVLFVGATLAMDVVALFISYLVASIMLDRSAWIHPLVLATIAIWPAVFASFGLYNPARLLPVSLAERQRGLVAAMVATVGFLVVVFAAHLEVRRDYVPVVIVCCLATVTYGRVVTRLLALTFNDWLQR
jgi:hypothetical protein